MSNPTNNELWDEDSIQFPRLLCEIQAALGRLAEDEPLMQDLCDSMGLSPWDVWELFDRAEKVWDAEKAMQRQLEEGADEGRQD